MNNDSNSRFDPERLLVKRSLAERWGQKEGEKTALLGFFCPHISARLFGQGLRASNRELLEQ